MKDDEEADREGASRCAKMPRASVTAASPSRCMRTSNSRNDVLLRTAGSRTSRAQAEDIG